MSDQVISQDLQSKSDKFFSDFRNQMQNDFGHIYKDLEFNTFFEGVVRNVVSGSLESVFGEKKTDENLQSRTSKLFGGVLEKELIPLFTDIKNFGASNGVPGDELVNYAYNYVIQSTSNILPQSLMDQLNVNFKKDSGDVAEQSNEKKLLNKWHMLDLISLAKADGNFDAEEKDYLIQKAQRLGVDIKEIEGYFESDEIHEFKTPNESFRKIEYFVDLVLTMVADGEIHEKEEEFCIKMGQAYQFPTSKVKEAIQIFQDTLKSGRQPITAVPQVIRLLKDRVL